jgi:hypothetical protein
MVKISLTTPKGVLEVSTDCLSRAAAELVDLLHSNGYRERERAAFALGLAFARVHVELQMFRYAEHMKEHTTPIVVDLPGADRLKGEARFTRIAA